MRSDTLLALEKTGLPPLQARTIVEAMETEIVSHIAALATKSDLSELRHATKEDLADFRLATRDDMAKFQAATRDAIAAFQAATRGDIATFQAATREDIAKFQAAAKEGIAELRHATKVDMTELRGYLELRIESVTSDVMRWVFVCILGQTAVLFAAASLYLNHASK